MQSLQRPPYLHWQRSTYLIFHLASHWRRISYSLSPWCAPGPNAGAAAAPTKDDVKAEKKKGGDLKTIELEGGELPETTSSIEGNIKVGCAIISVCVRETEKEKEHTPMRWYAHVFMRDVTVQGKRRTVLCVCVHASERKCERRFLSIVSLSLSDASFRNDTISTLALLTFVLGDHQQRLMEHTMFTLVMGDHQQRLMEHTMFTLVMEICSLDC